MNSTIRTQVLLLSCALALAFSATHAQDWPQWRGPNRDAKAKFTPPKSWPKELAPKWKVTVGEGVATPALVGDKLFVFARQEGKEILRCLDAASGNELWLDQYDSLGATGPASSFSGPRCSPTVAEGKVVTVGVRGVLSCLDASSGKLLWRKDDFQGAWPRFFVSSSPIVAGGMCVAQLGGQNGGGIVAYDLGGGAEKWKWTGDSPAYASPVLMTVGGAQYVVAQTETKVLALALADGKLAWETPFPVQGRGYNAATPIVEGATLIYAGSGRGAVAVKLEAKDGALAATELWKNPDHSVQFNTPVLKDGWLFGVSARNDVFCLNVADGKTAWAAPFSPADAEPQAQGQAQGQGGGPGGPGGGRGGRGGGGGRGMAGYASVVDAGSVLLALTPASQLLAFAPDGKAFTEIARVKIAASPTYAYPVVSGSRLFIKDQDSVALLNLE